MTIIKRIIAIIVLVFAILGMLVMIGGVAGSLAINNTITQVGVDLLTAGADFVGVTLEAGTQVETLLTDAQAVVVNIESEIERVGEDFSQTDILDEIAEELDTDLETIINDVDMFFESIEQTALALADALDTVQSLPTVADDTESVNQNIFRDAAADIDALSSDVDSLVDIVQRGQTELTGEVVTGLTTATTQLNNSIDDLLAQITPINTELGDLQTDLIDAQTDWTRLIDTISLVLVVLFLFIALAFLSLALHAWSYFVQPDRTLRSLILPERRDTTQAG